MKRFFQKLGVVKTSTDANEEGKYAPTKTYDALRFTVTETASQTDSCMQLSCLNLWDTSGRRVANEHVGRITNVNGDSPWNERPCNLLDGNVRTKFLNLRHRGGCTVVEMVFNAPGVELSGQFELVSANDFAGRDPVAWRLEGRAGGTDADWVLLDARDADPPNGRFASYGKMEFNLGTQAAASDAMPTIFMPRLLRESSVEVVNNWLNEKRTDASMCAEYRAASELIIVHPKFMCHSNMQRTLAFLRGLMNSPSSPLLRHPSFDAAMRRAIAKAYDLPSWRNASPDVRAAGSTFSSDYADANSQYCLLGGYHLTHDIRELCSSMGWRSKFVHAALVELTDREESSGLIGVLSLLARGGRECQARRMMAFSTLLQRVSSLIRDEEREEVVGGKENVEEESGGGSDIVITDSELAKQEKEADDGDGERQRDADADADGGDSKLPPTPAPLPVESFRIVRQFLVDYVEQHKFLAFKSAFLEPTRLVFDRMQDNVMRDDVEVHGSNVYACVVMATLGVCLPLSPFLDDEPKACCNFLDSTGLEQCFQDMLSPETFGRDFPLIASCRGLPRAQARATFSKVVRNRLVVEGSSAKQIGNEAARPGDANASNRQRLAPYLHRFARFFSAGFFLERAFNQLIGAEGRLPELQAVFQQFAISKDGAPLVGHPVPADVRQWVYDEDAYAFQVERALPLFRFIGIIKD